MRSLAWLILAAVVISFGPPARAAVLSSCTTGCLTDASGSLKVDYTVPSDGLTYRWDLTTDPSHPTATITLQAPNNVFGIDNVSNGNGTTTLSFAVPNFLFNEVVAPGHTTITVWSDADFNDCASNPAKGTICSADNSVFGNGANLKVAGVSSPVTITFAQTAIGVPEPAVWSLLIGGFGALGLALRRRRAAGAPAI